MRSLQPSHRGAEIADDLQELVHDVLDARWDLREGRKVPATDEVALSGGGVELDVTVLYADLAGSSRLASDFERRITAKVVKAFLACACRLISKCDGTITSVDGDRVMGVFVGDSKNSNAGECALQIKYAVTQIISPVLTDTFKTLRRAGFTISHAVGADTGRVLAMRAGQRGSNDLVWIGRAPNFAARLSEIRESSYHSYISKDVFDRLNEETKLGGEPKRAMWEPCSFVWRGETLPIYRSNWSWRP